MKIAVSVLAGLVAALGIALGIVTSTVEGQIGTQGGGYAGEIAGLSSRVSKLSAALSAAQTRLAGQRQDVITCDDLRHLQLTGTDSNGDMVSVGPMQGGGPFSNSVTLPAHCYNP